MGDRHLNIFEGVGQITLWLLCSSVINAGPYCTYSPQTCTRVSCHLLTPTSLEDNCLITLPANGFTLLALVIGICAALLKDLDSSRELILFCNLQKCLQTCVFECVSV